METEGHDPLAESGGDDPFDAVPADGGETPPEEPPLVQQGELGGYNPSEETEEQSPDQLADPAPADPLAEPDAGTPWNPGEEGDAPQDSEQGAPEAEAPAGPPVEPDPENTEEDTEADTPPADPEPEAPAEPDPPAEEPKKKKPQRKSAPKKGAPKKSERGYVVVKCDKNDNPVGIAGEVNARDDKSARRKVFDSMEETEARLCAVPERYWNVKTLRAKERTVRDIEED